MRLTLFGIALCSLLACRAEPQVDLPETASPQAARPQAVRLKATLWEAGPNGRQVVSKSTLHAVEGESASMHSGEFATRLGPEESRFEKGIVSGYQFRITPMPGGVLRCSGIWQERGSYKLRRGQIVEATGEPGQPLEMPCRQGPDGDDAWLEVRIVADE